MQTVTIEELLARQIPWSTKTFGTGKRTLGITRHIEKEIQEIRDKPDDLMEWVDVILLGLDGAWRSGASAEEIASGLETKQAYNIKRKWPKVTNEDEAVEHVRGDIGKYTYVSESDFIFWYIRTVLGKDPKSARGVWNALDIMKERDILNEEGSTLVCKADFEDPKSAVDYGEYTWEAFTKFFQDYPELKNVYIVFDD